MLDLFDVLVFRDTTTGVERVTILLLRNTSVRIHQNVSEKRHGYWWCIKKRGISWICIRPFSVRYSSKKMRQKILWHIIVRGALFYVYCIHCPWYKCISRKKQNMSFLLRPETLWEMNTICLSKDLILMVVSGTVKAVLLIRIQYIFSLRISLRIFYSE